MEIYIGEDTAISNIQHAFREAYPYLKLEFFRPPASGAARKRRVKRNIPSRALIKDIRNVNATGWIDIGCRRTALELRSDLLQRFGLYASILRKSCHLWIKPVQSEYQTLKCLNEEGKLAEAHIFYYPEEPAE